MGSQAPLGTKALWNTPGVSLPGPFRALVRELRNNGVEGDRAYATAWSQARKWAAKGNAKWARVVADLEAARAKAKATPNRSVTAAQEATMSNPCPTCGVGVSSTPGGGLALAMPPALAKAQAAGKTGAKKAPKSTGSPASASSSVQVPKGQEAAFAALVKKIAARPGMTQDKAEKAAAAILRQRAGKTSAKAS